ncbi:MAG: 2-isopropylmalate synthase [Terriglobales bacterium]
MHKTRITIFDTTLRDGEQSPGCSMNVAEKLRMARQLESLGVDVIEAGFPIASEGDFDAVKAVAAAIHRPIIAGLARACRPDIERAWEALQSAARPRIHVFLAASDIHLKYKLRISREQCIQQASEAIRLAKSFCEDVEFSPEDATRTDVDFLCQVLNAVVEAGATTLNIPDTVGYTTPEEFGSLIQTIRRRVRDISRVTISAHCHNDLGLAVANTLAAVAAGARQVECTINGIGERAGNASLEEIVMAVHVRPDRLKFETGVVREQLYPTSQMLSAITGVAVQPNKAIIGRNAFAHEAGIHQDGMLKNPLTYEIMTPQSVGVPDSKLVLGKHSGRHALGLRCEQLGHRYDRQQLDEIYRRFVVLADQIKEVDDKHLLDLITTTAPAQPVRTKSWPVAVPRPATVAAGINHQYKRQAFPFGVACGSSSVRLPLKPLAEHGGEQEDYLWGV